MVEPPAGLKGRIMAAAAADLETRSGATPAVAPTPGETWAPDAAMAAEDNAALEIAAVASVAGAPEPFAFPDAGEIAAIETGTVAPATPEPIPFPVGTERAARRRTPISSWVLRIAAVVAIVGLAGWNFLLRNQLDAAQSYEQSVAAVIEVAGQPGALTAILTPDAGTGTGVAAISSAGQVTLAMQDLAATSGATVYTTWVIGPDNVPVALGGFTVGGSGPASFTAGRPTGRAGRRHRADPRTRAWSHRADRPGRLEGPRDLDPAGHQSSGRRPRPDHPAAVARGPCRGPRSPRR